MKYKVGIEVYDYPNDESWVQAKYLAHSYNDVLWTSSLKTAIYFIESSVVDTEGEYKESKCKHENCKPAYDHTWCTDCGSVLTDSSWGIAKNKWFNSLSDAKFYIQKGYLPS